MAILAGSAVGRDMRGRLTGCRYPIVTTDAGTKHCRVVDTADPGPTEGGVTQSATVASLNMAWILTDADGAIVAIAAVAGDITVIETGMPPVGAGVAIIALIVALDMVRRLALGAQVIVAAFALLRRTHKQPVDMAAVTLQVTMTAGQWKAGSEVIELTDRRTRYLALHSHQREQQTGEKLPQPSDPVRMEVGVHCCAIHGFHPGLML